MGSACERRPHVMSEPEPAEEDTDLMGGPEGRTDLMGRGDGSAG